MSWATDFAGFPAVREYEKRMAFNRGTHAESSHVLEYMTFYGNILGH